MLNRKLLTIAVIVIVIAALVVSVLLNNYSTSGSVDSKNIKQSITTELLKNAEIKPFENATVNVRLLDETELASLKAEQPVVYSGAAAGDYLVVFEGAADSLIVIYDFENKRIVNVFAVRNVIL